MERAGVALLRRATGTDLTVRTDTATYEGTAKGCMYVPNLLRFLWTVATRGEIGFGEAFTAEEWKVEGVDLGDLLKELARSGNNESWFDSVKHLWPGEWFRKWRMTYTQLDTEVAKQLIEVAYDVSDDLFRAMLDPSMTYTCARWGTGAKNLEEAQRIKRQMLIDKAALPEEGARVLDIGCGWGGLVNHVSSASPSAADVVGISNSPGMVALAKQHNKDASNVRIVETDYRKTALTKGSLDAIFSVEMLEAIGVDQFPQFAEVCAELLKPGGRAVIQVITAPAWSNPVARSKVKRNETFVTTYIFPGSQIPHLEHLLEAMAPFFDCTHTESFGHDYARTLRNWRENVTSRKPDVPETLQRCYEYYLAWCEAGFATELLNVHQVVFVRKTV
ncbi:hypothetical protein TrVE_jg13023 [Triparma verrucosa]|uniref:Cyclopropane-fatty-acyl-phospholipid synthase n=1 Tax=Triparma verrucosa TaxID=1606542 RepID=A0A9W7F4P5_9STRA|nr:hypothetical protein TrVE_jg13023 [Triparma verrucosa]